MNIGRPESDFTKPIKRTLTDEEIDNERDIQEDTAGNGRDRRNR
jgi:hypothetical protein